MSLQARVYVHLLPSLISPGALRGGVAVVIDVLRATSVMVHALAAGATAVIPCVTIEEAKVAAAQFPVGTTLLCGERGGRPIEGFDLGNSPAEFTNQRCAGKILVMTTTNGTRAIASALEASEVLVAGFVNLTATAAWIRDRSADQPGLEAHLICAGTDNAVSYEDTLLAGALVHALASCEPRVFALGNDVSRICFDLCGRSKDGPEERLSLGQGGRNVMSLGLANDIRAAARVDRFSLVAGMDRREAPFRIVRFGT